MSKKGRLQKKILMNKVAKIVAKEVEEVGNACTKNHKELDMIEFSGKCKINYFPTSIEIAEYHGIQIVYKKIEGEMPSYFDREKNKIYISNMYIDDLFRSKKLVAHELGHYFLDNDSLSAMNDDSLNRYLPEETEKEYQANVFALILMPEIMTGANWEKYSPKLLNQRVYQKILEK